MSENPRRGRQVRNFTTNVPKILDLKSSSEQIFFRKLLLGAPDLKRTHVTVISFYDRKYWLYNKSASDNNAFCHAVETALIHPS